jgi:post-segregation antitoxin (ccd killing protein)
MARLNITVPDGLYEALEKWRDRLNISKICQDAIAREIAKLEDLPQQAAELEALVERLREEKARGEKADFAQGVSDGIAWARGAPYEELRLWGQRDGLERAARDGGPGAFRAALHRYRSTRPVDDKAHTEGWMAGVREVWQRVRDKV